MRIMYLGSGSGDLCRNSKRKHVEKFAGDITNIVEQKLSRKSMLSKKGCSRNSMDSKILKNHLFAAVKGDKPNCSKNGLPVLPLENLVTRCRGGRVLDVPQLSSGYCMNGDNQRSKLVEKEEKEELCFLSSRKDTFLLHFRHELTPAHIENLLAKSIDTKTLVLVWPVLGRLQVNIPKSYQTNKEKFEDVEQKILYEDSQKCTLEGFEPVLISIDKSVDSKLLQNVTALYASCRKRNILTSLQTELFSIFNNYQDLYYPQETFENAEDICFTYSLHALNHIIKSHSEITSNNKQVSCTNPADLLSQEDGCYRDQGFFRPKALVLLPFRSSALKVIKYMVALLYGLNSDSTHAHRIVTNLKRFLDEFALNTDCLKNKSSKPDDYSKIFSGNTNDNFRIGISLKNRKMSLYTEFYSSDIIIASPLGLRMLVGAPGDPKRDFDFLNSIELLIIDQAEILLAQNWDHILHIANHMHLRPRNYRGDYSRVRSWCLKGLSQFYRQTLFFSSHQLPEFCAFFENKCFNYRGKVHVSDGNVGGSIQKVFIKTPQIFYRIRVNNFQNSFDDRFNFFVNEILPKFRRPSFTNCMVYVPNYFDFVRLRNYFRLEGINFVQICEYSTQERVARARNVFYHGESPFLLYSERFHFFRRPCIKGIRHLIMYQPPSWPNLYAEIINIMQKYNRYHLENLENHMSITVLYTKYDIFQMNGIVGSRSAFKLVNSRNCIHSFSQK